MSTTIEQLREIARDMPGRKMPGERELADTLGIGRKQIRAALGVLAAEGLVVRRQGSGTFAADTANSYSPFPGGERGWGRGVDPGSSSSRSMTVALLVDAALRLGDDPFFSLLVDKIQRALQLAGIRCLVQRVSDENPHVPPVDAVVTVGLAGEAVIAALGPGSPPVVSFFLPESAALADRRVTVLMVDDRSAGARAAERLIERGCGSLVFAGMNDLPMSRQRLAGAHRAAETAGVPLRGIRSGSNFQSGLLLARSLADGRDPTPSTEGGVGIIAANDWMAVGIQAGLMSRGLLPLRSNNGELHAGNPHYRIVGFDGLDIAADPALAIDSVTFPLDAIVDDGVAEILRLTANVNAPGRVIRYAPQWRM